jgi:nucleotide-binding universal stress UspA family protein
MRIVIYFTRLSNSARPLCADGRIISSPEPETAAVSPLSPAPVFSTMNEMPSPTFHLLLAVDDTPRARDVIGWAERFRATRLEPFTATVLHVVPVGSPAGLVGSDTYAGDDVADMGRRLAEILAGKEGYDVRIVAGSPGPVICREAADHDLVVLGASDRGQLGELLVGSTSAYVAHHSPCDVLLLRRPPGERARR